MGLSEDTRHDLVCKWLPLLNTLHIPLVIGVSGWFLVPQVFVLLFQVALYWEWI